MRMYPTTSAPASRFRRMMYCILPEESEKLIIERRRFPISMSALACYPQLENSRVATEIKPV